jgi:ornithine cyclodeaminase/alanine dehydrogenase-like protein (mu-crystallin family)
MSVNDRSSAGAAQPVHAAFEIGKGPTPVLFMSEADVEACLDPASLLDALETGFVDLERGRVQLPPRAEVRMPGRDFSLSMPAWRDGDLIAVKVVNVFDGNIELGLPSHLAVITLFDPETGAARCVLDGTYITGIRTAGAAAVSARLLARDDARVATVVGAGVQARGRGRLFVESPEAFEPPPVGCAELGECHRAAAMTLGQVLLDPTAGRTDDSEITVYKAMGVAMEDMVAANLAYRSAEHTGRGQQLEW